ncbi:ZMY12-like protein [Mya arenaria]|uniref:ZMY12-like protein n=1 Tax=Mya arenaria TaxID=6604 RepID=A0ABY7F191_MYAAR|nr:ZMY12-like protein [Mya arenaria]WAR14979.1 ZMY12-like protein [Mya arenaria]
MTLNPLANPKGIKLLCELGVEHQRADWLGIHEKICQNLIPLRQSAPFLPSEEERQNRERQLETKKRTMIDLTRTTGQKLLFEGKHDQAVPAAMQSLRFAIDVHGLASIELVPSYLILGEASIGLGRLEQAEEYLAQAQWTVLKTPECSNAIKSKLYRNLGLLYAAKGEYDEALRQLANDVTDIWYSHLFNIVKVRTRTPPTPKGVGPLIVEMFDEQEDSLDEAQEAEAVQVLNSIYDMREHQPNRQPEDMARVCHGLAMLYFVLTDISKAKEFGRKAVVASESHPDDSMSRSIIEFMKNCDRISMLTVS